MLKTRVETAFAPILELPGTVKVIAVLKAYDVVTATSPLSRTTELSRAPVVANDTATVVPANGTQPAYCEASIFQNDSFTDINNTRAFTCKHSIESITGSCRAPAGWIGGQVMHQSPHAMRSVACHMR